MHIQLGELEGEVSIGKLQLAHMTIQRDSILDQLDSVNLQLTTLQSDLSKEKANSNTMQVSMLSMYINSMYCGPIVYADTGSEMQIWYFILL